MKTDDNTLYQTKTGYVLREIAGEYLAIPVSMQDGAESQIAILNESGSFLWKQLEQKNTVADLVKAMTDHFDVSETEAEEDILEFIKYLDEYHLIVTEEMK